MSKYFLLGISALVLLSSFQLEARMHVGVQLGGGFVERRVCTPVYTPVYVEEQYFGGYPGYYGGHAPVGCRREIYVQPSYYERVYVQPRPLFSFNFFR